MHSSTNSIRGLVIPAGHELTWNSTLNTSLLSLGIRSNTLRSGLSLEIEFFRYLPHLTPWPLTITRILNLANEIRHKSNLGLAWYFQSSVELPCRRDHSLLLCMRCALGSVFCQFRDSSWEHEYTFCLCPSGQNWLLYGRPKDESPSRERENDPQHKDQNPTELRQMSGVWAKRDETGHSWLWSWYIAQSGRDFVWSMWPYWYNQASLKANFSVRDPRSGWLLIRLCLLWARSKARALAHWT